jgi:Putative transposase
MSTSSFPAAACRRTGRAGSPANPASCCRCACCRASFVACFSKASPPCTRLAASRSSAISLRSPTSAPSTPSSRERAGPNGSSTPSAFAGPQAVLAYLARYTHRVAISNSRLIALDDKGVTFKWKDYRIKGRDRLKTMTLDAAEFIRRFLLHVLPNGFHRIRHYGLFAGTVRARNIERVRQWLAAPKASPAEMGCDFEDHNTEGPSPGRRYPCCGGRMIIVETFDGARPARSPSPTRIRIDTS